LEGNVLAMQGHFQRGRDTARAGLALALEHNHSEAAAEIYRRLGSVHEYGSDYAGAQEAYDTALHFCRQQGVNEQATICLGCMSWILLQTGDWKRGMTVSRAALDDERRPSTNPGALGVLGLIRAFRGETKQARRTLRNALEAARRSEAAALEILALWGLALLAEMEGAAADAHTHYGRMLTLWEHTQDRHDALIPLSHAVTFYAARGLETETARCAEALASIANTTGNTEALAMLAYALGEVAFLQEKPQEELRYFQQALAHLEKLELPLQQARTAFRAGAAAVRLGEHQEAVRHLTAAYRTARKLGARPLAAQIGAALESVGESVEDRRRAEAPQRADAAGLTRRQLEVLQRMAAGLTNKEIAQALFVSPRTVDMHVAHILDRLDCRSRTEAVARAADLGLLDR
jgi:ATP/maltotriose-dependent transcriptional regulator MalT